MANIRPFTVLWIHLCLVLMLIILSSGCEKSVKGERRGKIYWANLFNNRIYQASPDGSNLKTFAKTGTWPDAVVVDEKNELMYWTNMGDVEGTALNGSIQKCQMDNCIDSTITIVKKGNTATPKQLSLDRVNGYIYWADRDRNLIQRCRLDGSAVEDILILKDKSKVEPVGCEVDEQDNILYWSEKATGRIGRVELTHLEIPYTPQGKNYIVLSGLRVPTEIKVDKNRQKIFIAERSGRISSILISGGVPTPIVDTCLSQSVGLALDKKKALFSFQNFNPRT